jgi:WD40 repeat protein
LVAASAGLFGGLKEAPPATPPADAPPAAGAIVRTDREGFPLPAGVLARVGSARLRHGRPSPHIEYSPDGSLLASSGGGLVRLWEARTGKLVWQRTLPGVGRIPDGFFAADGKAVVVLDGQTCRWLDSRSGKEVQNCDVKIPEGSAACLAPRGEAIAVADPKPRGDLVFYDLPSGKERFRQTAEGRWLGQLVCAPDGKSLLAREEGGGPLLAVSLRRLDVVTGRSLGKVHPREFNGLAFAPDGTAVVGHDGGSRVAVTGVPSNLYLQWFDTRVPGLIVVVYAPDGKSLLVGGQGPEVRRLDLKTWKLLQEFRTGRRCSSLAFAPDGKTLAVAAGDGLITQWDLATSKRLAASAEPLNGFWYPRFDAGGTLLWACTDSFLTMNWRSGQVVRQVPLPESGSLIDVERWLRPGAPGRPVGRNSKSAEDLCAFPDPLTKDCKRVTSDGSATYKFPFGSPIGPWCRSAENGFPAPDKARRFTYVQAVARDRLRLAAANREREPSDGREVVIRETEKLRELRRLLPPDDSRVRDLAFSPDGNFLAAGGQVTAPAAGAKGGCLTLWDLRTGEAKFVRTGLADEFVCLTFSEDGRRLATGGAGGALRLWDAASGAELHRFTGHENAVYSVGFSRDGKLLAAASADAPLFVWDVEGALRKP